MRPETILFQVSSFVLAPLMLGVINKTKAFLGGRTGAPIMQTYFDIWKLLQKGVVYSSATTWVFRAGPVVGLAAVSVAMLLVPVGKAGALLQFPGNFILLAGLLGLMRFFTILAALDTASAFEGMGASREAMISAIAEGAFFLGLAVLSLTSGNISLDGMLNSGVAVAWGTPAAAALALAVAAIFLVSLAENARIPVDDPNTHLELTMVHEVMVLDHSGPDFGYIMYSATLKFWIFATLLIGAVLPFRTGNVLADGIVALCGILAVAVAVGIVESSMARLRMLRVPYLLVTAGALGVLAVTVALVVR